jgi:cyclase
MKRFLSLIICISFSIAPALGHGDNSHHPPVQDPTFRTTKLTDRIYMLQGRGGNIGALIGAEGILIVDDDYRALSEALAAELKKLGSERPRYILNTHWHGDHTEGNQFFGKESMIIAHKNVRTRLMDPPMIFGRRPEPYPAHALPIVTYTESMSIHFNGEEVRLRHYPAGHTDGDTIVFFVRSNVVHFGDTFFNGRFPFVDTASGGSVQGLINNIAALLREIPADAKLIPGHGPLATVNDLKSYHAMLVDTVRIVEEAMKAGKTLDEIKAAGFPEKYSEAGSGFIKTDFWIETIYNSLAAK